jgi:hypothetical protein
MTNSAHGLNACQDLVTLATGGMHPAFLWIHSL